MLRFDLTMSFTQILNGIDDGVKEDLANTFMQMILLLPDEQLKRENTEVLNHVLRCICGLCRHLAAIGLTEYTERFRLFWFENTVKVMNSGSLVLKLFAWEQFGELLQEAKFARPLASSYIVEGAGSDFVNGVYTMVHKAVGAVGQDNDVLAYTKAASKDAPLLTLFRCTMRTKAKWWFISQADLEKPGTDKDIDYYLHKTVQEEEREPPPRGWTRVTPGISLLGLDPPPSLKKGSLLIGKGMARESYFDFKLLEMCAKSNLLGSIFGPSMHREIVARSGKLLQFLTEYESFKHEDLQAIWKAALQCHDADIVDEIFSVLVPVAPFLSNSMFEALTGLAQDALQQTEHFAKIAHFVEKFAMENYKYAGVLLTDFASANLLALVWDVYKNAHFETLKNTLVIQELLSHCLSQKGGIDHVVPRILECKKALDVTGKTADEASVSRVIRSLTFLLTKHAGPVMIEELESHELVPSLICEVERYVLANRKRLTAGPLEITTFSMQLSDRLDLMRKFYSIHPSLTIPFEHLQSLSALLVHNPVEVEAFFSFLKNSSKAVVSVEDALKVFQQFVCSPEVDWARCGDEAFECFSTYYCELEGNFNEFPSTTELPPRLGLDTLWRIALNIGTHIASTSAINLLLQAYDTIMFQEPEAYSDMLRIVFSYLEDAISTVSIETDGNTVLSLQSQARVYRCISILSAALAKSKGEAEPAHAVRGTMFRMNITVFYRRVTSYFNSVTQTDVTRYEKGSEGLLKMEVHPLHTIKDLKERIIEQADLGSVTINFEHPNKDFISNTSRVSELNLADGGELSVTYQSSFHTKSYEDDLYSENTSTVGNSRVAHIGQILSNNYSMFDSLLTLCELCKDADLTRSIWQLIMLIPTQVELIQQSVDQVTYQDASTVPGAPATTTMDWNKILQSASETRTAYLLQIIDNILQPAPELITPVVLERSVHFRGAFIATDGFATVLRILISAPTDDTIVNTTTLAVALHIVHFLLFGPEAQSLNTSIDMEELDDSIDRGLDAINTAPNSDGLLEQVEASSAQVIEKLLHVARNAAAQQSSQVVQNALMVITKLIKSSEAASQLSSNPQSEVLLTTVLRSESKKVREMAANFAVQVGRTQPVVFRWLLSQLKDMSPLDHNCSELFTALSTLLTNLHSAAQLRGEETVEGSQQLARILSDKLLTYPRTKLSVHEERNVLQGYLETLDVLIGLDPLSVKQTQLGENLVESFLNEFLFTMPTEEQQDGSPICDSQLTRQAAFHVLASYLAVSQEGFEQVLGVLGALSKQAARHMHGTWGMQVSHDVKKPEMTFTGLKNQGCTCYMNSLLQVLFMSTAFREAVLATPLLEIHRTTLWHKSDIDLVGNHYLFEYASGSWRTGQIIGYDPVSAKHRVQYTKADGTFEEAAHFNVHQGRHQRETGRVRVIPSESDEPLNEREDAAYRVLDQLQRTFCFMKLSKKRYFDPVHFVDACKSLNLNFNVYHQNDAAEFCDQLLDRIETATKGKHTKKDIWRDVFLKNVFGGNWLYQKIPQDCEVYSTSKEGCGHWQSSRLESFLKVELMIRGKEKIEDSLAELMQGELMDGDNKIHCDVCTQKKATVRRTCFGGLPNTMVLHLKRFDLDFQTFETVKLNNRMAFPARINMLEYTKEGIEAEEKRKAAEVEKEEGERQADEVTIQYETADGEALDPSDFEYELQGVLVHAGIAQGGHYYSFIRDDATADQWYKFDDDEVTPFSSDQIPTQCFGGPPSANNSASTSNLMEEDRTSNALMLLYNKVKKASPLSVAVEDESTLVEPSAPPEESQNLVMVDGTQAYQREVRESNMQHILTCYLLDPDLHSFVRGMLSSITSAVSSSPDEMDALNASITQMNLSLMQWDPSTAPDDLPLRTVQFNCSFLLDVVLHCRERAAMRSSIHVLSAAFDAFPHTAMWFLSHVLDTTTCAWFLEYTLHSADALARAAFVQIVVAAVSAIAPKDPLALSAFKSMKISDVKIAAGENHPAAQLALLVRLVLDHTFKSVLYTRNADELFVLIRDLAALPCMNKAFLEMGLIAFLSYFIMPDQVAPVIRTLFEKHLPPARLNARIEYTNLLHCVFEALAALLGVPQIRKVSLLQERTYYESDLVPDAREALSTIFAESSHNGGMDATDITKYFEKVTGGTGTKVAPQHIRNLLDRFHTSPDGRLSLTGFLQYHTDAASYNPKNVWRVRIAFLLTCLFLLKKIVIDFIYVRRIYTLLATKIT